MSAHCSTREASGGLGCAVALVIALVPVCFAAYGAWSPVRWIAKAVS